MNWDALAAIGELAGAAAVLITLLYLAIQVRQNTAQQRRDEYVAIYHGQNSVLSLMVDPMMQRAYARAAEHGPDAPIEDRARAINFVLQYINHFQIVHDLFRDGALDEERYTVWEGWAVAIIAPKGIRWWWENESGKLAFQPAVRNLIDARLRDTKNPPIAFTELWPIFSAKAWESAEAKRRDDAATLEVDGN